MKPLESITILEFSTMITASLASMMMAEQGARVIKVEPMAMGDPMRYIGARKADISALFANCNRGKESLRIDLKSEEGVRVIKAMIPSVDVVIHNFRPGVWINWVWGLRHFAVSIPSLSIPRSRGSVLKAL